MITLNFSSIFLKAADLEQFEISWDGQLEFSNQDCFFYLYVAPLKKYTWVTPGKKKSSSTPAVSAAKGKKKKFS